MRTQCQVQDSADLVSSEVGSLGSSRMGQFSVMREERGGFERRGEIAAPLHRPGWRTSSLNSSTTS